MRTWITELESRGIEKYGNTVIGGSHRILCNLFVGESFNQSAGENVNNYNGQARIIEAVRDEGMEREAMVKGEKEKPKRPSVIYSKYFAMGKSDKTAFTKAVSHAIILCNCCYTSLLNKE